MQLEKGVNGKESIFSPLQALKKCVNRTNSLICDKIAFWPFSISSHDLHFLATFCPGQVQVQVKALLWMYTTCLSSTDLLPDQNCICYQKLPRSAGGVVNSEVLSFSHLSHIICLLFALTLIFAHLRCCQQTHNLSLFLS